MENRRDLIPLVEAIIFASDKPISADKIAKYLEIEKEVIEEVIDFLMEYYKGNDNRGIEIKEVAEGFFFRDKKHFCTTFKKDCSWKGGTAFKISNGNPIHYCL